MGTQFAPFFDVIAILAVLILTARAVRKGFVQAIGEIVALIAALFLASALAPNVSDYIYERFAEPSITDLVSEKFEDLPNKNSFEKFSEVDSSKVLIDGKSIEELKIAYDDEGVAAINLNDLDLSATGITKEDLSALGINFDALDLTDVSLGKITLTTAETRGYSSDKTLSDIILSKGLAEKTISSGGAESAALIRELKDIGSESFALSSLFALNYYDSAGGDAALNSLADTLASLFKGEKSLESAFISAVIKPIADFAIKNLVFLTIFAIVLALFAIVLKATRIFTSLPIVGILDKALGFVIGLAESAVAVYLFAFVVKIVIVLTGDGVPLFNTRAIEETVAFKYVFNLT